MTRHRLSRHWQLLQLLLQLVEGARALARLLVVPQRRPLAEQSVAGCLVRSADRCGLPSLRRPRTPCRLSAGGQTVPAPRCGRTVALAATARARRSRRRSEVQISNPANTLARTLVALLAVPFHRRVQAPLTPQRATECAGHHGKMALRAGAASGAGKALTQRAWAAAVSLAVAAVVAELAAALAAICCTTPLLRHPTHTTAATF